MAEAMQRHGLKSAGKRARLESAAEDEAEALLKMQVRTCAHINTNDTCLCLDVRVCPLASVHRWWW